MRVQPRDILNFWFAHEGFWFQKNDRFDEDITRHFRETHEAARCGQLQQWMETAEGALALVITLDQFPRNMFRNDARAWADDEQALAVARAAIAAHRDVELPERARRWLYMPFMHAEELSAQEEGLHYLATRLHDPEVIRFAGLHADVIRRFGRFPHRNEVLGRRSTPDEQAFLDEGGFAG
ncbi:MAG: DUF924 domain-containing protein [Parvibaculaceae bacterium]|nr:DUF924 domain-containing protein [Parvibaculaceae bacterium]